MSLIENLDKSFVWSPCLRVISKNLWRGREHALFDGLTFAKRDLMEALDGRLEAIADLVKQRPQTMASKLMREGCLT
jgi:hypothetical protein